MKIVQTIRNFQSCGVPYLQTAANEFTSFRMSQGTLESEFCLAPSSRPVEPLLPNRDASPWTSILFSGIEKSKTGPSQGCREMR